MVRGTTSPQTFRVPFVFEEEPLAIQITYRQYGKIVLQRQMDSITIELDEESSILSLELTQEETLKFVHGIALVHVRIVTADGQAHASDFQVFDVFNCGDDNILPITDEHNNS